jgi:predicted outer membrane protein
VFNKNKPKERKNKILFVDASGDEFYSPMSKGLGDKHNELKDEHIEKVVKLYQEFKGQEHAKVLDINELLFDEVKTKRLFQRSYILNEETLEKIKLGTKFNDIVEKHSKDSFFASEANSVKDLLKLAENELKVLKEKLKKDESNENLKSEIEEKQKNCAHYKKLNDEIKSDSAIVMNQYKVLVSQEKELTKEEKQFVDTISLEIKKQENILSVLSKNFDDRKYLNRKSFEQKMNKLFPELLADKSSSALLKEMIDTCGEYDEEADIIKNEYDSEFNDSEILKHNENIDEYFEREVKPYSPTTVMVKDSLVVGCKIE